MQGFCLSRWVAAFPQTGCGGREPRVPCQTRSFQGACGHHLHGGDEQAGGRSSPGLVRETAGRTPGRGVREDSTQGEGNALHHLGRGRREMAGRTPGRLGRGRREREREREHPGLEPTRGGRTGVAMRRRGPGGRGARERGRLGATPTPWPAEPLIARHRLRAVTPHRGPGPQRGHLSPLWLLCRSVHSAEHLLWEVAHVRTATCTYRLVGVPRGCPLRL